MPIHTSGMGGPAGDTQDFGTGVPSVEETASYKATTQNAERKRRQGFTVFACCLLALIAMPCARAIADSLLLEESFTSNNQQINRLYNYNTVSGAVALVSSPQNSYSALAYRPSDGTLFATTGSGGLYTLNPATGVGTLVGQTGISELAALAIDPINGNIYGMTSFTSAEFYKISSTDASSVFLGYTKEGSLFDTINGLAFSPNERLYSVDYPSGLLYTVNTGTGAVTRAPNPSFETDFINGACSGMTFGPSGLFASDYSGDVFSINLANGEGTRIGTPIDQIVAMTAIPVPEPTSIATVIAACASFLACGRTIVRGPRRRR